MLPGQRQKSTTLSQTRTRLTGFRLFRRSILLCSYTCVSRLSNVLTLRFDITTAQDGLDISDTSYERFMRYIHSYETSSTYFCVAINNAFNLLGREHV